MWLSFPNNSRVVLTLATIIVAAAAHAHEPPQQMTKAERPVAIEIGPLSIQEKCALDVTLRPSNMKVTVGRKAEVEIRFANHSDQPIEVFDPDLSPFISGWSQGTTVLAILDRDGNMIGDLLKRTGGSAHAPIRRNWVTLPPGGIFSTKYHFTGGIVLGTPHFHTGNLLPPAKYFLELRIHERVLSSALDRPNIREWMRDFPGKEICRSNRVELELVPRTGD